jgi:hypothetical protein
LSRCSAFKDRAGPVHAIDHDADDLPVAAGGGQQAKCVLNKGVVEEVASDRDQRCTLSRHKVPRERVIGAVGVIELEMVCSSRRGCHRDQLER